MNLGMPLAVVLIYIGEWGSSSVISCVNFLYLRSLLYLGGFLPLLYEAGIQNRIDKNRSGYGGQS